MDILSITSETHTNQIIQTFGELFRENVLTDVTLVCDDQTRINAHKIVLSAGSPLFRAMFLAEPQCRPLLYLRGLEEESVLPLLQFLYLGETSVNKNSVPQFLRIAKEFQISGLEQEQKDTIEELPLEEDIERDAQNTTVTTMIENKRRSAHLCDKCNHKAGSLSELKKHLSNCHAVKTPAPAPATDPNPVKEQKLACHQCRFICSRMDLLKEHVIKTHVKELKCNLCDFKTVHARVLQKHTESIHQ